MHMIMRDREQPKMEQEVKKVQDKHVALFQAEIRKMQLVKAHVSMNCAKEVPDSTKPPICPLYFQKTTTKKRWQ